MNFEINNGLCTPFGISKYQEWTNFAIEARHSTSISLCLYQNDEKNQKNIKTWEIQLNPIKNRTDNVWHIGVRNLPSDCLFSWKVKSLDLEGNAYKKHEISDPYAKTLISGWEWGEKTSCVGDVCVFYHPLGVIDVPHNFDWQGIHNPNIPLKDLIIYEMHVRGFTQDCSSKVAHPGTFLGIIEKIPYLKELGINALELMPVFEFNEAEFSQSIHKSHERLCNFWGYSTVNFFSPMQRFASSPQYQAAITDFKTLVRELHRNQIEVILDVVYNHTAEGNENGPTLSFKALDQDFFYIVDQYGQFRNYSGCGNTVNCNASFVTDFIIASLRYWVEEMHVDGFRFDLASILTRDQEGEPMAFPPLIDRINHDPILKNTKLIAEPWDAAGLYQVGSFPLHQDRWAEWNGRYRDAVRRFIKGDTEVKGEFATRICGSQDLYGHGRGPWHSINFVTSHDGFTLADLVSYNHKHNLNNGEKNLDGANENHSWNCGVEGPTPDEEVVAFREKQKRNLYLALMISQGVPMILMGDEYGHTKNGNNNSWCHDNELNWFLWNELDKSPGFFRFCKLLHHFRLQHSLFRHNHFLTPNEIEWHGLMPHHPVWDNDPFLAYSLIDPAGNHMYIAFNVRGKALEMTLPPLPKNFCWYLIINTCENSPNEIFEEDQAQAITEMKLIIQGHSAILLKAK